MPGDGLAIIAQPDFSAGAFQGIARHLIPENGVYAASNALLDDDGSLYKRGGSQALSTSDFGNSGRLPLFLFDGYLSAGQRTVFADSSNFGALDSNNAPVTLGGGGVPGPRRGVVIGGVLVCGGGKIYGGSLKTANYSTGTITTTNGSKTITGSGTTWNTLVDAGMLLKIGSERYYVVASVDSTTQITLTEAYEGSSGSGKAYTLSPIGTLPAAQQADVYAVAGNRLVVFSGRTITFSNGISPGGTGLPPAGQLRWQTFTTTDKWEVPDGVQILGAAVLRDVVYVFTTAGVYALSNLDYDLTDAAGNLQQRLDRIAPDLILWGNAGIASWGDALVVPATDGVWLIDGVNPPRIVSRSIVGRYRGYVATAYQPGGATVYRGHYVLPIVSATNQGLDLLFCRLDRPTKTAIGDVCPWSWASGAGAQIAAANVRQSPSDRPKLIGGGLGNPPGNAPQNVTLTGQGPGAFSLTQPIFYKVTAIVNGSESAVSAEVGWTRYLIFTTNWLVSWDPVAGATSYRVYRGTTAGAEDRYFTVAGSETSYLDTNPSAAGTAATPPAGLRGSRILDLSGFFEPAAAVKHDHDGTDFEFDVTTRDFTPDRLNIEALVRQLRVRYELDDAASDDPTLSAWYSLGVAQSGIAQWDSGVWDTSTWADTDESEEVQLAGQAPEDDGRTPYVWTVGQRTRFIRFRLRSAKPAALLVLRSLELKVRPSGRQ